ncbi:MAG: TIGR00159 family protein [Epulopiscium sp. Nele67-Bin004]|nr:MAG: TIGR00159 family protein [Epulopiscium sp. Nele67-Bin004]
MDFLQSTLEQIPFFTIPSIQIKDALDIALVGIALYKIILWIKDTRTWSVFKGIVIIFTVAVFAYLLELHTVSFIITNTITVGTITIIVLFQPELRRALEQLGQGKIWEMASSNNDKEKETITEETIASIVKSCSQMSKTKTGALIVIESHTPLTDYERTGINIDACISSQLLINIFEKNTPLHDGAIVISKNRIAAATCFLPLSDSLSISKELGTRHRAAIGVSEETDATVVVVSEETGAISYVANGKIKRNLDTETLTNLLTKPKKPKDAQKRKISLWKGRRRHE